MSRDYQQYCPVARALELVGERWTLLIARELLLGPRRFTDLRAGLPGISANVLATRLRELEHAGLIARRPLPPPAASTVYELTDNALGLVRVLRAMAEWGMSMLGEPRGSDEVRGGWLVLGIAATTILTPAKPDAIYELRIGDDTLQVQSSAGHLQPQYGPATNPDAVITMDTDTLAAIVSGALHLDTPRARNRIAIQGDTTAARRLLDSFRR